jgi:hypothetical protein
MLSEGFLPKVCFSLDFVCGFSRRLLGFGFGWFGYMAHLLYMIMTGGNAISFPRDSSAFCFV